MTKLEAALVSARKAQDAAAAALQAADQQVQALTTKRETAAADLEAAKAAQRAASSAMARGGREEPFDEAVRRLVAAEHKLAAMDGEVLTEAHAVRDAAAAAMPSPALIPALELRLRIARDLSPLHGQFAEAMATVAAILGQIAQVHAALRQEHREAYPTVWPRDPTAAMGDLLRSVPPPVRAFMSSLFHGVMPGYLPNEDRALSHDPAALERFADRIGQEPPPSDLAKFGGPVFTALAPPPPPDPRPDIGPAKMRGFTAGQGAI